MNNISGYAHILHNLTAAYENRLINLSGIKDVTLELKLAIEKEEETDGATDDDFGIPDMFDEILDRREIKIDEHNIIMTTINHYKSQLPSAMLKRIDSAEKNSAEFKTVDGGNELSTVIKTIKEIAGEEQIISGDIQAAEKFNLIHMKKLMDDVKKRLDNIKKNRIIMDRFVGDNADIKTGALINKKK